MIVVDKHSMNYETEHPEFCEIVKVGARRGVFLSRNNSQYLIHMEGDEDARKYAAGIVQRTYELDVDYRETFTKEYNEVRRKGGLKIGSRRLKRRRADLVMRRKQAENKGMKRGIAQAEATDPIKNKHIQIKEGDEDKTACISCGKAITPRHNTTEPFMCASCAKSTGSNRPIFHIGSEKE